MMSYLKIPLKSRGKGWDQYVTWKRHNRNIRLDHCIQYFSQPIRFQDLRINQWGRWPQKKNYWQFVFHFLPREIQAPNNHQVGRWDCKHIVCVTTRFQMGGKKNPRENSNSIKIEELLKPADNPSTAKTEHSRGRIEEYTWRDVSVN